MDGHHGPRSVQNPAYRPTRYHPLCCNGYRAAGTTARGLGTRTGPRSSRDASGTHGGGSQTLWRIANTTARELPSVGRPAIGISVSLGVRAAFGLLEPCNPWLPTTPLRRGTRVGDEARTEGWHADPTGRFQYRYWDGATERTKRRQTARSRLTRFSRLHLPRRRLPRLIRRPPRVRGRRPQLRWDLTRQMTKRTKPRPPGSKGRLRHPSSRHLVRT
jgi:hypothetical protein